MTADKDALLREALPCVQYSVNKWAERACAIAQKSFRFPSGAVPTQQQVDETFDKWKQMERLATRITAALAEKDAGRRRRIVCAANLAPDGVITLQVRHCAPSDHRQGFIDNQGNWLTREQAYVVAKEAGQIIRRVGGDEGKLFSENIY